MSDKTLNNKPQRFLTYEKYRWIKTECNLRPPHLQWILVYRDINYFKKMDIGLYNQEDDCFRSDTLDLPMDSITAFMAIDEPDRILLNMEQSLGYEIPDPVTTSRKEDIVETSIYPKNPKLGNEFNLDDYIGDYLKKHLSVQVLWWGNEVSVKLKLDGNIISEDKDCFDGRIYSMVNLNNIKLKE